MLNLVDEKRYKSGEALIICQSFPPSSCWVSVMEGIKSECPPIVQVGELRRTQNSYRNIKRQKLSREDYE